MPGTARRNVPAGARALNPRPRWPFWVGHPQFNPTSFPLTGYAAVVVSDGPEAYWRLGSAPLDDTADGHTLAATGAPSSTSGLIYADADTARTGFTGTDYYDAADSSVFDVVGGQAFTVELWVNVTTADSTFRRLISHEDGSDGWELDVQSTSGFSFTCWKDGSPETLSYLPSTLTGAIHHIVGTYDGSDMRLYVDGVLQTGPTARPAT